MLSMVSTVLSADIFKLVYVVPPETPSVPIKVLSAPARVMVVLRYVCAAIVAVQPSSHSVPVPHLFFVSSSDGAKRKKDIPCHWT